MNFSLTDWLPRCGSCTRNILARQNFDRSVWHIIGRFLAYQWSAIPRRALRTGQLFKQVITFNSKYERPLRDMNWFKCRLLTGLLLSFLVMGNHLAAQDLDEANFVRYTRLEGLSNNFISGIVQDSAGYIWIATHKGINRFDGKLFQSVFKSSTHSPLPDNLFRLIRRQPSNEIIGATRAGAFSFNPATGQI